TPLHTLLQEPRVLLFRFGLPTAPTSAFSRSRSSRRSLPRGDQFRSSATSRTPAAAPGGATARFCSLEVRSPRSLESRRRGERLPQSLPSTPLKAKRVIGGLRSCPMEGTFFISSISRSRPLRRERSEAFSSDRWTGRKSSLFGLNSPTPSIWSPATSS